MKIIRTYLHEIEARMAADRLQADNINANIISKQSDAFNEVEGLGGYVLQVEDQDIARANELLSISENDKYEFPIDPSNGDISDLDKELVKPTGIMMGIGLSLLTGIIYLGIFFIFGWSARIDIILLALAGGIVGHACFKAGAMYEKRNANQSVQGTSRGRAAPKR